MNEIKVGQINVELEKDDNRCIVGLYNECDYLDVRTLYVYYNEKDKKEKLVAKINVNIILGEQAFEDNEFETPFFLLCDGYSQELGDLCNAMDIEGGLFFNPHFTFSENILYVDEEEVMPKCKKAYNEIREIVFNHLGEIMFVLYKIKPDAVVVYPAPVSYDEPDERVYIDKKKNDYIDVYPQTAKDKKEWEFFTKLGFKELSNSRFLFRRYNHSPESEEK